MFNFNNQTQQNGQNDKQNKEYLASIWATVWDYLQVIIIAAIIVVPVRTFVFQPFIVSGASMQPTYWDKDYLLIDELSYRFSQPQRGDVIVFKYPKDPKQRFIKRIIGLPGEMVQISNGHVYINQKALEEKYLPESVPTIMDQTIQLKDGQYFVLGDNRMVSYDSRSWGPLPSDFVVGKVMLRPVSWHLLTKSNNK